MTFSAELVAAGSHISPTQYGPAAASWVAITQPGLTAESSTYSLLPRQRPPSHNPFPDAVGQRGDESRWLTGLRL